MPQTTSNLLNHFLLVFRYYFYISKEKHIVNIYVISGNLIEIKKTLKRKSLISSNNTETCNKWLNNSVCRSHWVGGQGIFICCFHSYVYCLQCAIFFCLLFIIANTKKYLQSDWLRGVQYWPHFYSVFNICTLWLRKKTKKTTFDFHCGKIEMHSLKKKLTVNH